MPVVLHPDPFSAVLLSSPALPVTDEQKELIREVLNTACSDSRFAQKAYIAIYLILTGGIAKVPKVTSLSPNTVDIGSPSFDIHVHGTGFTPLSKIVFNGFEEPTTFVSPTELTTGVNMPLWLAPAVVPVAVLSEDGVMSDPLSFSFVV